jgi:hypothetical protein
MKMIHYSATQWFDFERETVSLEMKALMQRHLEEDCEECRKLAAMWREVLEIGRRELNYWPPESAVLAAKAALGTDNTWKWLPKVAQVARLIFDSLHQPLPAAVRGSAATSRQLLQEATPFVIDLRVECEPRRKWMHIIGQVLNSKEPNKAVTDVEVFLLHGENLAAKTKANSSGEFDLQFKIEDGLQLFIDIRGHKVVEIRLPTSQSDCQAAFPETE